MTLLLSVWRAPLSPSTSRATIPSPPPTPPLLPSRHHHRVVACRSQARQPINPLSSLPKRVHTCPPLTTITNLTVLSPTTSLSNHSMLIAAHGLLQTKRPMPCCCGSSSPLLRQGERERRRKTVLFQKFKKRLHHPCHPTANPDPLMHSFRPPFPPNEDTYHHRKRTTRHND